MKDIKELIADMYSLILRKDGWFNEEISRAYADDLAGRLSGQFKNQKRGTLRLSAMGPKCPRALWYSIHSPEKAEPIPPYAEVKYAFGHMIEALAIVLAKASGHEVTGEQDELVLDGIVGHRDCVIDGCLVDVKSTSSRGLQKFKSPQFALLDDFGYLDQLDGYVVA